MELHARNWVDVLDVCCLFTPAYFIEKFAWTHFILLMLRNSGIEEALALAKKPKMKWQPTSRQQNVNTGSSLRKRPNA